MKIHEKNGVYLGVQACDDESDWLFRGDDLIICRRSQMKTFDIEKFLDDYEKNTFLHLSVRFEIKKVLDVWKEQIDELIKSCFKRNPKRKSVRVFYAFSEKDLIDKSRGTRRDDKLLWRTDFKNINESKAIDFSISDDGGDD